jgi:glycine/D-amino acid oxidase-like deaminating enzyme
MGTTRRAVLKGLAASALWPRAAAARTSRAAPPRAKSHVAVVGAGAFGGWTALHLLRRGARVTLLDAWGPGHSRASSGGETRVIRGVYGPHRAYVDLTVRSFDLWAENEERWKRPLYTQTGALWLLTGEDDSYVRAALPLMRAAGLPFEELTAAEVRSRYPQIAPDGVRSGLFERRAGYLLARRACEAVADGFRAEGGEYRQLAVRPGRIAGGEMEDVTLSDGSRLRADAYVFACGPWLGQVFPDAIGDRVRPSRQEVFFFGTPAGDPHFLEGAMPVWVELGTRLVYGIPGNERRGFKVADDTTGPDFDPTSGERVVSAEGIQWAHAFLARRFPALARAPLVESRVCQYERSPDGHFILDRHPAAGNVWLAGGGSGHGFKHGPAVGERLARLVLGEAPVDPFFGLARLARP